MPQWFSFRCDTLIGHSKTSYMLSSRPPALCGTISALLPFLPCQGLRQLPPPIFRDPPPREGPILRHTRSRTAKVRMMTCRRSYHPPFLYLRPTYRLWTHSLTSNYLTTHPKRSHPWLSQISLRSLNFLFHAPQTQPIFPPKGYGLPLCHSSSHPTPWSTLPPMLYGNPTFRPL